MNHIFSLARKTALVIGGGGVLAGEVAAGLAGAGADVVIAGYWGSMRTTSLLKGVGSATRTPEPINCEPVMA